MPENRRADLTRPHRDPDRPGVGRPRWTPSIGLLAGAALVLATVPARAQTLTDALAEAYNTNPQILAQRALLRATDEQVPQALSFWRPTVAFTGQVGIATGSLERPPTAAELAAGTTRSVLHQITRPDVLQFQATEPIYRGGRT